METKLTQHTKYIQNRMWASTSERLGQLAKARGKTKVQMNDDIVWEAWKDEFQPEDDKEDV